MAAKDPAKRKYNRLMRAIAAGDAAGVCAAIDAGADPNGFGHYTAFPLTAATRLTDASARDAMTELLLAAGADPHRRVWSGDRPIFDAAWYGYDAVVRMLLAAAGFPRDAAGAPERRTSGTLLVYACISGMRWLAERALAEGCRADDIGTPHCTALHHATVVEASPRPVGKDTAWLIGWLLDHGAPLEHSLTEPALYHGTALHWAVERGDEAAVRALVDRGADLEARTHKTRRTPLFPGVRRGSLATVRAAIACGADITAVDAEGKTLLHEAARNVTGFEPDTTVLELLLAAGVDPSARDSKGMTAHAFAVDLFERTRYRQSPPTPGQERLIALLQAGASKR